MQFPYFLTWNEDVAAALQMEAGCNYYDHFFVIDLIRRGISFFFVVPLMIRISAALLLLWPSYHWHFFSTRFNVKFIFVIQCWDKITFSLSLYWSDPW